MKNWRWVLAAVLLLLLAACGPEPMMSMSAEEDVPELAAPEMEVEAAPEKASEEVSPVILTEENNGETITMQVGQELHIFLGGNPTTGYMWASEGLDSKMLGLAEEPEYTAASDAIGSGGEFDFFFTMKAPGETMVTLEYMRDFEKDVDPIRTFSVTLVIEE
jgi:inhibitor of cysteine peptidase